MADLSALAPTAASGLETSDNLATVPFLGARVTARRREWLIAPTDIPAEQNATGPADLTSMGTGTCAISEVTTSEIAGFNFDNDSESVGALWRLPDDIDLTEAIYFACLWLKIQNAAAATGSAQLSIVYTPITAGTTALAVGATALDTVIADQADAARYVPKWTALGAIAASTLTGAVGIDLLATKTAVDLTTITDAHLMGVLVDFARKFVA